MKDKQGIANHTERKLHKNILHYGQRHKLSHLSKLI